MEKQIKNNELISVIVPVYKVEKFLKRCVDSIVNQTYKNLEIILVDDGSPDNCPKMCDEFAKNDKRIRVIHKKNGGLSDARNAGIENCKGNYVFFIDSDDYLELNAIEILYNNLVETGSQISIGKYAYVYDDDEGVKVSGNQTRVFTPNEIMLKYTDSECVYFVIACSKLIKRETLGDIRFPVGKYHEDEFVTYKIICNAKRIVITEDTLYRYYQNSNSIMHNRKIKNDIDAIDAKIEKIEFCKNNKPEIYDDFIYDYLFSLMHNYRRIMCSKEIEKTKKKYYKNKISEFKKGHKIKLNFRFNTIKTFPKIMTFVYNLKEKFLKN